MDISIKLIDHTRIYELENINKKVCQYISVYPFVLQDVHTADLYIKTIDEVKDSKKAI